MTSDLEHIHITDRKAPSRPDPHHDLVRNTLVWRAVEPETIVLPSEVFTLMVSQFMPNLVRSFELKGGIAVQPKMINSRIDRVQGILINSFGRMRREGLKTSSTAAVRIVRKCNIATA